VTAMYAMYKALEDKKVEIKNHGAFRSLETTHNGAEGFWLFEIDDEPVFLPKFVVELLAPGTRGPGAHAGGRSDRRFGALRAGELELDQRHRGVGEALELLRALELAELARNEPRPEVELPAAMKSFTPAQEVETPAPTEAPLAVGWESPDIQRRLNDVIALVQSADTRYVRVISKTKTGKQQTMARIAQGTSPENVMKIIMHVRRRSKDPTVMAEVLNVRLKRTLARSFPIELAIA